MPSVSSLKRWQRSMNRLPQSAISVVAQRVFRIFRRTIGDGAATIRPTLGARGLLQAARTVPPFRGRLDQIEPQLAELAPRDHRPARALPESPLLLWCNEDTPLLWARDRSQALTAHPTA